MMQMQALILSPCRHDKRHRNDSARNADTNQKRVLQMDKKALIIALQKIAHGIIEVASGDDRDRAGHQKDERGGMTEARATFGKGRGEGGTEKGRQEDRACEIINRIVNGIGEKAACRSIGQMARAATEKHGKSKCAEQGREQAREKRQCKEIVHCVTLLSHRTDGSHG